MRKAGKRPNKMDFYLMDSVKICRSKQDVGKVTSTWNRTTGNPKNYYHQAQAGSRDVGKFRRRNSGTINGVGFAVS